MQNLRFRRYASLFKTCLELSLESKMDLSRVFYEKSINMFVGPILRKDLIEFCFPQFMNDPSLIRESSPKALIFCYLIVLEANDDPM